MSTTIWTTTNRNSRDPIVAAAVKRQERCTTDHDDYIPSAAVKAMVGWLASVISPEEARPPLSRIKDDSDEVVIDMLVCRDQPRGSTTLATVSLHRYANMVDQRDIRTELAMVVDGFHEELDVVLGSAGINVGKDSWPLWPGVTYPNIITDNIPSAGCPHRLFTAPGTFPELASYELEPGKMVYWLQAVPIHESERVYLRTHGLDALEGLLAGADAQIGDLHRPPVV